VGKPTIDLPGIKHALNQLAHCLEVGVGPDVLVGLCGTFVDMIVGVGIMKREPMCHWIPALSGGAAGFMLNDTARGRSSNSVRPIIRQGGKCEMSFWMGTGPRWRRKARAIRRRVEAENLAYVIYTSGAGWPRAYWCPSR
jgi:hypothetical protein